MTCHNANVGDVVIAWFGRRSRMAYGMRVRGIVKVAHDNGCMRIGFVQRRPSGEWLKTEETHHYHIETKATQETLNAVHQGDDEILKVLQRIYEQTMIERGYTKVTE